MKQTSSCLRAPGILFLLLLFSISVFGQTVTVKGTVKDASNSTLPGVNVRIQGSTTGTITDVDGKYTIQVPSNAKLVFSFVGYTAQVVSVAGKTTINVTLSEDTKALSEVVVVGYGTQRKEAVTGSVASVNGDQLRDVPAANISRALQGRVAGVEMSQTDSKPGSGMQIRIRGTRSLNATNDPLVVLDGIPFSGSIGDIDPNIIKSVDILKDASATAIYGSRGANGVILVTTIKGSKGQSAQLSYNGYFGVKSAIKFPMMNGAEFAAMRKMTTYANTLDESNDVNTDWQDLLYRTGVVQNHNLNLSGGTEKGSYNFGASYFRDQAVIPLQYYTRYAIHSSLDQEVGKFIKVGFTSNNIYSENHGNNLGPGSALNASPIANPYNADGTWKTRIQQQTSGSQWVYTRHSLESLGDQYVDLTRGFSSYNSAYGEVKIPGVEGLKARVNLGADYIQSNYGNYTGVGVFSGSVTNPSTASINNSHRLKWTVENLLTYDRTFNKLHRVNAVAMYSAEQATYWSSNVSAKNIPSDAFQFYNLGQSNSADITVNPNYQNYNKSGLTSAMGRVMYSYNDRYMLSATVRTDGSSRLAPGHQWHTYPAVSAGWNIKDESFMQPLTFIDRLKLRAGYGETSNQSVDPYKTLGLLSTSPYNFGDNTYATGYYVSQLPNPKLGWEFSKTWNVGVDFTLLKSRLTGTIEYYIQNTDNVLLSVSLPPTSGANSYMANIGATQNKGLEVSLNGVVLDNVNGWTWEVGLNVYTNKNKLTKLASGASQDLSNGWFVGHSINVIYDYKKIGLWNTTDPDYKYLQTLQPGGNAGMIKVLYTGGYNADGTPKRQINSDDRQILNCDPDFQGGFNTRVSYKNFDLSMVGSFVSGGILNSTLYGGSGYLNNMNTRAGNNVKVDYWTPTNTGAKYPKPGGLQSGDNPYYASTLGYFSASYLKVRTITLGYNFNQKWLQFAGISKMRIYATVENPFVLFSPYHTESGMDPEPNSYGDQNVAVAGSHSKLIVGTNTPSTHNYVIGLNVTF